MARPTIIETARKSRGWTQTELAKAAGTSQATVSAYERREKSPSLGVVERLVGEAGYTIRLDHTVDFSKFFDGDRLYWIPDRLWRVEPRLCFSKVKFPDAVAHRESGQWQQRYFDLAERNDRRRVYLYLLRAGIPVWIWRWVDGALLIDLWDELDLPHQLKAAWQPLIDHARGGPQEDPINVGFDKAQKQTAEERKERIAARRAAARAVLQD
jgi:transcriptional regulator with XRE-family HTH domain